MFPYSDILDGIIYGQEGSAQHILIIIILSGHTRCPVHQPVIQRSHGVLLIASGKMFSNCIVFVLKLRFTLADNYPLPVNYLMTDNNLHWLTPLGSVDFSLGWKQSDLLRPQSEHMGLVACHWNKLARLILSLRLNVSNNNTTNTS